MDTEYFTITYRQKPDRLPAVSVRKASKSGKADAERCHSASTGCSSVYRKRVSYARRKRRRSKLIRRAQWILAVAFSTVLLCAASLRGEFSGEENAADQNRSNAMKTAPDGLPYVVALDAGHGGEDCGAQGIIDEKDMTEMTAGFLEELLVQDEAYRPVRTHPCDTFASPKERADAANDSGAVLLISIHGNSAPDYPETVGFECYPQPPGRRYHEASVRFAHLIAQGFENQGQKLRGEKGVRFLYYQGDDQSGYKKQIIEESDLSVYEAQTFGLLERAECPAVLTEQCFITCAEDVEQWGCEEGCRRAARIYYEAICAYFGTQPL